MLLHPPPPEDEAGQAPQWLTQALGIPEKLYWASHNYGASPKAR